MQKNTQLLIAYMGLFACAAGVVWNETNLCSVVVSPLSEAEQKAALRREKGLTTSRIAPSPPAESASTDKPVQLPRGIFLVRETMSVQSTDGQNHELTAGCEVTLLRRENGKLKISREGNQFLVEEHQVTRNIRAMEKLLTGRKGA